MRPLIKFSGAAAIAGLLTFSGPLGAANVSPELQDLIKKANAEGKLHMSWSSNSLGGAAGAKLIQKRMNKMFGTNIKFSFSPGRSMPGMSAKIRAEAAAGRAASSDVYLGAAWTTLPFIKRKNVVIFPWTKLLPGRITNFEVEGNGASVRIAVGLPGITYNTKLMPVKKRPTVLADFLHPAWKGKLASTPYAAGFDTISAHGSWGPKKITAFIRKFSKQVRGLIRCGEAERIATGEYFALVMDCTGQDALLWQRRGAPVANFIPLDAAQKRYYYLTVPKNSSNKNAAALYAVFMMTKEGQKSAWDTWRVDLDSFPESHLRKQVQEVENKGGKFISATIDFIANHPEVNKTKKVLVKILKSTRKKKKK